MTATDVPGDSAPIFAVRVPGRKLDIGQSMKWARQTYGKGALRQFTEIAGTVFSRCPLEPREYFLYAMFRPGFDRTRRRTYMSQASNNRFSDWLMPSLHFRQTSLMANKVLLTALFERTGVPIPPISALYSATMDVPGIRMLKSAGDIAAYLSAPDSVPCFAKPVFGSSSIGAISIIDRADGGATLRLGNGREVASAQLAAEIVRHFRFGFIFQPILRQHADIEAINGDTVGILRVVTLLSDSGPQPLYATLRLPPPGAMADGASASTQQGLALVDLETGAIVRAQNSEHLCTTPQTTSVRTGLPLNGVVLPFMADALALAARTHAMFPAHGQLAHDVVLTPDGPVLTEVNARPMHVLYQRPADRGALNPSFQFRFQRAATLARLNAGMRVRDPKGLTPLPRRLTG